jgi:tryptophan-rich sensory protein
MNDYAKFSGIALFPNFASYVVMAISGVKGSACPKTDITPPGWVFGVVWPVLYLLVGIVMARMEHQKRNDVLARLFWLVVVLNLWYVVFAPKCYPLAALVGIVAVLIGTVWVTVDVFRADSKTGRLMLPLCLWLTFATVISAKVLQDSRVTPA